MAQLWLEWWAVQPDPLPEMACGGRAGAMRGLARCFRWCPRWSRLFAQNLSFQKNLRWTQTNFLVLWFFDGSKTKPDENAMYLQNLDHGLYMSCIGNPFNAITLVVFWIARWDACHVSESVSFQQCSNVCWLRILAFKEAILLPLLRCSFILGAWRPS